MSRSRAAESNRAIDHRQRDASTNETRSPQPTHGSCDLSGIPSRLRPAFDLLFVAYEYACQTSGDSWEFAVEIDQLADLGLTLNDFRWLVRRGFVEHQREVTLKGDDGRAFRSSGDLTFTDRTCFVLTDAGIVAAREFCESPIAEQRLSAVKDNGDEHPSPGNTRPLTVAAQRYAKPSLPQWDAERRELRVDGELVKRFKWTAPNQEMILAAFDEEEWPSRIDDPLPPQLDQDPKRRLADTIKCLNRKQVNQLLHFRGDGTGEGVIWEFVGRDDRNCNARR